MSYQNWAPNVLSSKPKTTTKDMKNQALNDKNIHSFKKAPTASGVSDGRKIHKILESESLEIPQITTELRQAIIRGRIAKEWKQKDLAFAVGVKESIVSSYESGKAVPENAVIAKMEQVMGCKLPRPPKIKH